VIAAITLIYNLAGVLNFASQMSAETTAALPDVYRSIIEERPIWVTIAFALAVIGGAVGCILLLLRKSSAYQLFIASLLGAIVTLVHTLWMSNAGVVPAGFVIGNLVQLAVTLFLVWYAKLAGRHGWIR